MNESQVVPHLASRFKVRFNESKVQRLFSILLLVLFALPLLTPLLALAGGVTRDADLPACCRRDGAHRCAMSRDTQLKTVAQDRHWSSPVQTCPFRSVALLPASGSFFRPKAPFTGLFSAVLTHPHGIAQTQSRLCIARERSRQKRGPPASSSIQGIF